MIQVIVLHAFIPSISRYRLPTIRQTVFSAEYRSKEEGSGERGKQNPLSSKTLHAGGIDNTQSKFKPHRKGRLRKQNLPFIICHVPWWFLFKKKSSSHPLQPLGWTLNSVTYWNLHFEKYQAWRRQHVHCSHFTDETGWQVERRRGSAHRPQPEGIKAGTSPKASDRVQCRPSQDLCGPSCLRPCCPLVIRPWPLSGATLPSLAR